jgi:hypothetical protein
MAYPAPFIRLVLGGNLYGSKEQWTCSLSIANGSLTLTAPTEVPLWLRDVCATWMSYPSNQSVGADLRWLKFNRIGYDGRYTEDTTVRYDYPTPYPAGTNPTVVPPQVALAITLRTEVERGRAARGRFFSPLPARTLASDGVLGVSDQDQYVSAATDFLTDLNEGLEDYDTPGERPRVVVMSDAGEGMIRPVRCVSVGRVLDTMRSRRASIPEIYRDGPDLYVPQP